MYVKFCISYIPFGFYVCINIVIIIVLASSLKKKKIYIYIYKGDNPVKNEKRIPH